MGEMEPPLEKELVSFICTSMRCAWADGVTYTRVDSERPAVERVPARRRPDSEGRFVMPASLVKDELARLCRPDLEKLFCCGGSKRRENILILMCNRQRSGLPVLHCLHPNRLRGADESWTRPGMKGSSSFGSSLPGR